VITTNGMTTLAKVSKDLIADQTFNNLAILLNQAACLFDVTHGLGDAANTSSVIALLIGGFDAQKITATLNFPSPTTAGTENLGVFAGALRIGTGTENYLYACADAGTARIQTIIAGVTTTLTSTPWSVAQAVSMTISLQRVGTLLTANFSAASGPAPVQLQTNLSGGGLALQSGGIMGARSLSKAIWCTDLVGQQVA
jgi:hypothetical protein